MPITRFCVLTFLLSILVPGVRAQEVLIAAASDLSHCWPVLATAHAQQIPEDKLSVAFGSSGSFYAQIKNGGPYQVFLSADEFYPQQLVTAALADDESLRIYAYGRLALWTQRPDIDIQLRSLRDLQFLQRADIKRIAIANPAHAPYGRAARALLEKAQVWSALQGKIVNAENIAQAVQFVQTGNADIGLISASFIHSPALAGLGYAQVLPVELAPPLAQALVLTHKGKAALAAQRFVQFMRSEPARGALAKCGFAVPEREQ